MMLESTRLLGDGKHGCTERMQTFRGPACRSTFTSRRNTPLYRLKTPSHQIAMVLVSAGRRARLIRSPAGLRLSAGHDHEPFCSVLMSTHTPCTSTSSAISGSLTSSWTNYAPGCATPHRCVFLWLAIDPCTKILPVLELGPRTQHMAHMVLHSLRQILAAFLPPALYRRRAQSLLLCHHCSLWSVAPAEPSRAQRAPVADGAEPDLRPAEAQLSSAQAGARYVC